MKSKSVFVCSSCGYESIGWLGQCPDCGEWNSFVEEVRSEQKQNKKSASVSSAIPCRISDIPIEGEDRILTGISELDRVMGGGIVKGSVILIGGDPGIGKSTMLLQMCGSLKKGTKVLYISGEESSRQIMMRASRLGVNDGEIFILNETNISAVLDSIQNTKPDIVIIDSIQTMFADDVTSSTGSVSQVRECTMRLTECAKSNEISVFIVGHVNKEGSIAGPKVMEHIVDTVLYFEGERTMTYRILRAVKNRFGSTNEIGVFEMTDRGLMEVDNPSARMLEDMPKGTSGNCVICLMEGSRPILTETQALVTPTGFGNPRRMSNGFEYNRFAMLLAVLEKRCGYRFSVNDVYINAVGGLKIDEPAADLGICTALVSAMKNIPIPETTMIFGEVGLGGEVRTVSNTIKRIKEAERLGFTECILPAHTKKSLPDGFETGVKLTPVKSVFEACSLLFEKQ